jgi:predicted amidohydrolase
MNTLSFSLIQFPIHGEQSYDSFWAKHLQFFDFELKRSEKPQLIIFPELVALDLVDFSKEIEPQWKTIATEIHPRYLQDLKFWSRQHGIDVLSGSLPALDPKTGRYFNQCSLIKDGALLKSQNKVYLTPEEKTWNWASGLGVEAFDYRGIKTAILICHDSEFSDLSVGLAEQKPELLLVPSMTHDIYGIHRVRWCSQARSVEHHCYSLVTGTVESENQKQEYAGQAAVITPQNSFHTSDVLLGPYNQRASIFGSLNFERLRQSRSFPESIYPARDYLARRGVLAPTRGR